jgi:hypothetical protein
VQVEVIPLQAKPHPTKLEFASAVSVSVTRVPARKAELHVVGQLIPVGELTTVPVPFPRRFTLNTNVLSMLKVAVTCWFALRVNVQVRLVLPSQPPPDQLVKIEFAPGAAVSITFVPDRKGALQVVPQLMPEGVLVTVPVPVPERVTPSVGVLWTTLKVAVTVSLALSVTVQVVPAPLQPPPDQPTNAELVPAVAVRVTEVPVEKPALQVAPQLMPAGVLATAPVPLPFTATVSIGEELKLAVTEVFCVSDKVQTLVPLQPPDQPAKKEFAAGVAVSVTLVPLEKLAEQA